GTPRRLGRSTRGHRLGRQRLHLLHPWVGRLPPSTAPHGGPGGGAGAAPLARPGGYPRRGGTDFRGPSQSTWLGEQIQSQAQTLLGKPAQVVREALSDVRTLLTDPGRNREATLDAIFTLHCRLLEALTVEDFRLGKAYGLGRAMAETAILPADAITDEQRAQA